MKLRILTLLLSFFFACYATPTVQVTPLGAATLKMASVEYIQVASAIESGKARLSQHAEKKLVLFTLSFPVVSLTKSPGPKNPAENLYQSRKLIEFKSKRPRAPPV